MLRRTSVAERSFGLINLLLPLSTGSLHGNYPLWVVLAREVSARRRLARGAFAVSCILMLVYSFRWGAAYPPN